MGTKESDWRKAKSPNYNHSEDKKYPYSEKEYSYIEVILKYN